VALREDFEKQGNWLFRWRSYLPLLIIPLFIGALRYSRMLEPVIGERATDYWEVFAMCVSFLGLVIRCLTVGFVPWGTSGRNTKAQFAESLNTTGMYSIVRNPLYLANFIIVLGITLFIQVWWLALIVWIGFGFYYERIIFAEEEFLRRKFGAQFIDWANKTPVFFPKFKNWKSPNLSFSLKTVFRKEFSTFFSIVSTFFFLEIGTNLLLEKRLFVHTSWLLFYIISLIIYLIILIIAKKTKLLHVSNR
jgi:protein-S-isoprenylcysteine O-methyltransferase Ste14